MVLSPKESQVIISQKFFFQSFDDGFVFHNHKHISPDETLMTMERSRETIV
jgi:hypothetical protein